MGGPDPSTFLRRENKASRQEEELGLHSQRGFSSPKCGAVGALYPGQASVTTQQANPGASANRAPDSWPHARLGVRDSGHLELWGQQAADPVAFISVPLCSFYLRLRRRPREATLPIALLAVRPLQCPAGLRLQRSGATERLANWARL